MLHGGVNPSEMFGAPLAEMAKTHQVIAIQLRGHGFSTDTDAPWTYEQMADDVAACAAQIGIARRLHGLLAGRRRRHPDDDPPPGNRRETGRHLGSRPRRRRRLPRGSGGFRGDVAGRADDRPADRRLAARSALSDRQLGGDHAQDRRDEPAEPRLDRRRRQDHGPDADDLRRRGTP